ncbi:protein giant [Anopheles bellator]|uniref:protein giant n=1 Tax=Anopheles bellator TaxID=139047 RepID=UPI00264942C4|nr:protein giant [Anopheles bellator]
MMAQFMMDLKPEPRLSPSLYSPASPKMADSPSCRPQSTDSGVLDLSKRRDSLETTRKTPSPSYHCFSDGGGTPPPSNHSSPQCEAASTAEGSILLNYSELIRGRRLSPTKSLLHFEDIHQQHHRHHHHQLTTQPPAPVMAPGLAPAFHHALAMAQKPATESLLQQHLLQRGPALPSYLLSGAGALQTHHHHHHHGHQQHQFAGPVPQQQTTAVVHPSVTPLSPSPIRLRELDAISESGSEGTALVSSSERKSNKDEAPKSGDVAQRGNQYPMVVGRDGKLSRPFKAYPRDPLSLAAGFVASDTILDTNSAEKYNLFRKRMLEQIHAANGGQPTVSNPKMRRLALPGSVSSPKSAALSDASSESCDEKTPSRHANDLRESKMAPAAAATMKKEKQAKGCSEMAQRADGASSNQRLAAKDDSDSSHHSDADVTRGTASSSDGATGSGKDSAYYERRKKNNAAAKKSRDRRRIKEDEIAIRAAFLERENIELKFELAAARKQLALYGVTASVAS